MRWTRHIINPLMAFIALQVVLGLMVFLWIYWVTDRRRELQELAQRYRPDLVPAGGEWFLLSQGIVLLLAALVGVYVLFLFWRRQSTLYLQQQQLIAQVTHELKSPLASIQLHLETIRLRQPDGEMLERFLDTMLNDAERLNSTISKLLMTARLEQRRGPRDLAPLNLSLLVEELCASRKAKLPEGASLEMDLEDAVTVRGDRDDLEVVLANLFENATLYTTAPPVITVSLHIQGRRCILSVRDQGEGIDPRELKRVFRRFYRADNAGLNRRGTGLGLYIVRSIIQDHGGSITASCAGRGSGCDFRITLPLA
jgi:signal transduction histidine kinase